jgi:hypothetical protein
MSLDSNLAAVEARLLREQTATALRHGPAVSDLRRRRRRPRRPPTVSLWRLLLPSTGTHRPLG